MSREKTKSQSMLEGSLWDKILFFALPLAASSMLQQLFNSADTAVVGRFAGSNALAAVGSTSSLINLLVNLFIGLSVGTNVVISNMIGQKNYKGCRRAVHTSIVFSGSGGLIIGIAGLFLAGPVLRFMGTPADILDMAILYMRIFFLGVPFMMVYNFAAAVLRSKGDTRRPLIILAIAGIINVLLNLFFVIVLDMSVAGVAIATVSSNVVSCFLVLRFLMKEEEYIRLDLRELKLDHMILGRIISIGTPAAVQSTMFNIANVIIQVALNSLGSVAIAAQSASVNGDIYVFMLFSSFGQAAVTFAGQNYGAGDMKRCRRSIQLVLLEGELVTIVLSALLFLFAGPFIRIFTQDPEVVALSVERLRMILILMPFNAFQDLISGGMRGIGHSTAPAVCTCLSVCVVRILFVYLIFPHLGTFLSLIAIYPITWVINDIALLIMYFVILKRQKSILGPA